MEENKFEELFKLNVNDNVDKLKVGKSELSYLSWAWAWAKFMGFYPLATYEIIKNPIGLPYFVDVSGAMVYTKITAGGITHEMWLPVLNGANKPMRSDSYTYSVKGWNGAPDTEKTVEALNMFDVNKTVMRCLVKNMAMFGLGLYIYAKEDLPEVSEEDRLIELFPELSKATDAQKKSMQNQYVYLLKKQDVKEIDFRKFLITKELQASHELHKWLRDETLLNELITEFKKVK